MSETKDRMMNLVNDAEQALGDIKSDIRRGKEVDYYLFDRIRNNLDAIYREWPKWWNE